MKTQQKYKLYDLYKVKMTSRTKKYINTILNISYKKEQTLTESHVENK